MKTIKAFIKSHPLLSYFALTFAITWAALNFGELRKGEVQAGMKACLGQAPTTP